MFTWPTSLKYPESKPSTPLTPLKYPESMSKYNEATAEVYLDMDEGYLSEVARGEKQVHRGDTPCSRPLCKCADFGAVEPRNLGDFRSNFNGGEILRASLLLSPRLIFSSK